MTCHLNEVNATLLLQIIRFRLQNEFSPTYLAVRDDSAMHIGHSGYHTEGSHFSINIRSSVLQVLSRIDAHRKIYALFADYMPVPIHALSITIQAN